MKYLRHLILFICLSSSAIYMIAPGLKADGIQTPGTAGLPFLKIGFSARPQALSENFAALSDDVSAFEYNPAGLAFIKSSQYEFTHISLFDNDVAADSFMFGTGFGDNAVGLSVKMLKSKDFVRATEDVGGTQTVVPSDEIDLADSKISLGYANTYQIDEKKDSALKFGITLNSISETLDAKQATAFTGDIGLLYSCKATGERWGASLQNAGSATFTDTLPMTLRVGTGYTSKSSNVGLDLIQSIDSKIKLGLGVELLTQSFFILRLGGVYQDSLAFSAGFGLDFKYLKLDYAYTPNEDLGTSSRISLLIDLSPKTDD